MERFEFGKVRNVEPVIRENNFGTAVSLFSCHFEQVHGFIIHTSKSVDACSLFRVKKVGVKRC